MKASERDALLVRLDERVRSLTRAVIGLYAFWAAILAGAVTVHALFGN